MPGSQRQANGFLCYVCRIVAPSHLLEELDSASKTLHDHTYGKLSWFSDASFPQAIDRMWLMQWSIYISIAFCSFAQLLQELRVTH